MARRPDNPLRLLDAALERRAPLLQATETNVGRLFHDTRDGVAGLVIEKLGHVLVAQLHEGRLAVDEDEASHLCAHAAAAVGCSAVYRKVFPVDRAAAEARLQRQHADPHPWIGTAVEAEFAVREHGLTFLVHPYDGYATGLFLDHRAQRVRVRELAAGRRILNGFAYTCGFAVAAALGGALSTVNVDLSKKALEWGKRNLRANGLGPDPHRFIWSDMFEYYRRARRQNQRFDMVILDPPTFSRARRPARTFSLKADLEQLVTGALELLEGGGYLLLSVSHRETTGEQLQRVLASVAQKRGARWHLQEWIPLPPDFRDDPDFAKAVLVRLE